jgi:hypothetical protein
MKKLLFLTAAIGFAFSLNAQQTQIRENVPASTQKQSMGKMDMKFTAKPANILNADVIDMQKSQKKGEANYNLYESLYYLTLHNARFSLVDRNSTITRYNPTTIFPDSLVLSSAYYYSEFPDSVNAERAYASMGFVFDPYSVSFDAQGERDYFGNSRGTYCGYKIDTLAIYADYRIVKSGAPDTLRFYAWTHNVYRRTTQADDFYYGRVTWENGEERRALFPIVDYSNPIPSRGPYATAPLAEHITWDYYLSKDDTLSLGIGQVNGKYIVTDIPGDGLEVDPGSVAAFMVKYIPGDNSYQLNDTISVLTRGSNDTWIKEEIRMNRFGLWYWDIGETQEQARSLWDRNGYNTIFNETQGIRYATDTTDWGNGAFYDTDIYKAMFYFNIYKGDNIEVGIKEPGELISAIYPNPATSQLTIDLKEEGQANVAIYNILGQALIQENVYNMSNTINISNLSQGMYVVKVTQNGKVSTVKFSKQ